MALKRSDLEKSGGRQVGVDPSDAGRGGYLVVRDLLRSSPRRLVAGVAATLALLVGAIWLASAPGGARGLPSSRADLGVSETAGTLTAVNSGSVPVAGELWVHVAGSVVNPGVYALAPGSRVKDAVGAAGGPSADAEISAVNLAAEIADGEQVFVPSRNDPAATGATSPSPGSSGGNGQKSGSQKVNINKADAAQLDTLPGIGPSTAEKIIAFRVTNGPFKSVEELQRVDGIGDAKFKQLAQHVTVS